MRPSLFSLTVVVCQLAAASAVLAAPAPSLPPSPGLRLPAHVRPVRYALELWLDPAETRYRGTVRIDVELSAPSEVVWLHAQDLTISAARVATGAGGQPARPVAGEPGYLGLVLERPAGPGRATLELTFEGAFDRTRSRGLYAVSEGDAWYAYTFFEPIDARRAFPCFDEPAFKVPWRLTFHVPAAHVALGNSPVASETVEGGQKTVVLAESKPMSTYQVAFVSGPFDLVDAGRAGREGVAVRFIVPRGRGSETRYAAEVTPRIVGLLEDFFGMAYPYEKLDVAVVPRFWGTMEHPGIVALGQPLTLISPAGETRARKERYATIAIHELVHYWFGDYVTMAWWDDIWLNESLTSWADADITESLEPTWRHRLEQRQRQRARALRADAMLSVKRLREPVRSVHEIEGAFDNAITYDKGAAVAAMFEASVGPEQWRSFIRRYLAAHAWGTASSEDFLAALRAEVNPAMADAFGTFVEQPGVPLVSARASCGKDGASLVLTQERFLMTRASGPEAERTWSIPVCVRYSILGRKVESCTLLSERTSELPLSLCPDWVVPDSGGVGYYVTAWEAKELAALRQHLDRLTVPEQLSMATSVALQARRGDLPLGDVLALVPVLARSPDRLVVDASLELVHLLAPLHLPEREYTRYRRFLRATYGARARALGWLSRDTEDEEARALRHLLVPLVAGVSGEPALVREAAVLAGKWLDDRGAVPVDVGWGALGVAVRTGGRTLFERIRDEARQAPDRQERARLLALLGGFEDTGLAREARALVLDGGLDLRDSLGIVRAQLGGRRTRDGAWAWVQGRFDELGSRMRSDEVIGLLHSVGGAFCDVRRRAEVESFFTKRVEAFGGAPRVLANKLEQMDACIAAARRSTPEVARFLGRR